MTDVQQIGKKSPLIKATGTLDASPRRPQNQVPLGSSITLASRLNYSEMPIDNADLGNKERLLQEHRSIQRKLQESALKDYNFGKDIQDLIYTKYKKDQTRRNRPGASWSPRSEENVDADSQIEYPAPSLLNQNQSYLSMKQDHDSSFMKVKEGILKNQPTATEKLKNRYATGKQKYRNIFFDGRGNEIPGQGATAHTNFHRGAHRSTKVNRKVLNVYKRFGQSKQDVFVANVARQTLDQESTKLVNVEQSLVDSQMQSEAPDVEIKSILQRYKHKQSAYHTGSKLSFPDQS